ncbi:hypothetical protein PSPO01_04135 [Paraphaeosphaeria sporulosa]
MAAKKCAQRSWAASGEYKGWALSQRGRRRATALGVRLLRRCISETRAGGEHMQLLLHAQHAASIWKGLRGGLWAATSSARDKPFPAGDGGAHAVDCDAQRMKALGVSQNVIRNKFLSTYSQVPTLKPEQVGRSRSDIEARHFSLQLPAKSSANALRSMKFTSVDRTLASGIPLYEQDDLTRGVEVPTLYLQLLCFSISILPSSLQQCNQPLAVFIPPALAPALALPASPQKITAPLPLNVTATRITATTLPYATALTAYTTADPATTTKRLSHTSSAAHVCTFLCTWFPIAWTT